MSTPSTRRTPAFYFLPCFALAALGGLSAAHGQATVSVVSGSLTPNNSGVTTATFNEITPTSFYGTGGTLLNPTTVYTTPTTLANATANGTATFSGITPTSTLGAVGTFVSGSASGAYGAPTNDTTTYAAIGGSGRSGAVTLTFSNGGTNYFGLDWASPDTYNSVVLTFKNGTTTTYTPYASGTTPGTLNLAAGAADAFVNFYSTTPSNAITQVQLSSTSAAFELDNVAFGVVPEPSTWLGGLGLLGAAGLTWQRRRTARA